VLFDFGQGIVCGVGPSGDCAAATGGVETPDECWIGEPGLRSGDILDPMAVPESSRAAEGSEAAFGGDSSACEDEESVVRSEVHVI